MHIRDLRCIRPMLDFKTASTSTIAASTVHSKLDYCNSLFLKLESAAYPKLSCMGSYYDRYTTSVYSKLNSYSSLCLNLELAQLNCLQLIQNSLARAVTRTPRHHHITPILKSLHWLEIPERIHFKFLSLAYNSFPAH